MKNNIIAILICVLTYIIVKMCMGDFTFESDTYGYYKVEERVGNAFKDGLELK